MKRTLYLKFLIAYLIFGVFAFAIVTIFVPNLTKQTLVAQKAETFYSEATLIANTYASGLYTNDTTLEMVKLQLDALSVYMESEIRVISPVGRIILDSSLPLNPEESLYITGFDPAIISGTYYIQDNFFGSFQEDVLTVIAPITSDYMVKGYVTIHTTIKDINATASTIENICYITLAILYVLSFIILIFFNVFVYRPLKKITAGADHYADGNYHYEIPVETNDEMGYLAASLNYMAGTIASHEDDQKKFVANVSHDFRSPLTSIRGFLEAMIDGTIPPEMHEKYLNIVLNETDRLTKLTNSLLTLNNLNTKGMLLDLTDFDINQVIRQTAASFEGSCRSKNIAIALSLTGEDMVVHADTERIKQVLYNLIDNAIKFSHNDSVVTVGTTVRKNKLFISVKDTGVGIPKDEVKLIFNRFYKSDSSRGKDKKGTGLGLSIVKEIINAHNENINVVSTQGEGTEF
ncbi:MAG: HAMP domain-containing histidine kinase, partial [Lachnospiraceae bacterium]|nr:HAMP domain-containing histidine kinase [Lachnospiraceae bacterium]